MKKIEICFYCGGDAKKEDHSPCQKIIDVFRSYVLRHGAVTAMQLAENGFFGATENVNKEPEKSEIAVVRKRKKRSTRVTDKWIKRALILRDQGLDWKLVAKQLSVEGYKSARGKTLNAKLISKNLWASKNRRNVK